jgi:hypothetical protein
MALRTGYSVPLGSFAENSSMSDWLSGQVPLLIDIGGKPIPNLFVAGYLGLGFGGVAGQLKAVCDANRADCLAVSVRLGAEVQYHILPDQLANPWIGYGIGFEGASLSESVGGNTTTDSVSGFEFAHLMAGVDLRTSGIFGFGPFVDAAFGTYTSETTKINGVSTDRSIDKTAGHQWLTFGLRGVFFP